MQDGEDGSPTVPADGMATRNTVLRDLREIDLTDTNRSLVIAIRTKYQGGVFKIFRGSNLAAAFINLTIQE